MKRTFANIFLLSCLLSFPITSFAQKIYVYCPASSDLHTNGGKLAGSKINLVLNDIRRIPKDKDNKIECESEEIKRALAESIINSFPAALINYVKEKPETNKGEYTIIINITAYHSASGTTASEAIGYSGPDFAWGVLPSNRWNSVAGYDVSIESKDNNTIRRQSRNIANVVSRPNIGGSLTAKKALNEAYTEARRELLFFIESTLTEKETKASK